MTKNRFIGSCTEWQNWHDASFKENDLLKDLRKRAIKRAISKVIVSFTLLGVGLWLVISETGFNWRIALGALLLMWGNNLSVSNRS